MIATDVWPVVRFVLWMLLGGTALWVLLHVLVWLERWLDHPIEDVREAKARAAAERWINERKEVE